MASCLSCMLACPAHSLMLLLLLMHVRFRFMHLVLCLIPQRLPMIRLLLFFASSLLRNERTHAWRAPPRDVEAMSRSLHATRMSVEPCSAVLSTLRWC